MTTPKNDSLTRREILVAGVTTAAAISATASSPPAGRGSSASSSSRDTPTAPAPGRLPVVFVPHGGGPWPFVKVGFGDQAELDELATYLRSLQALPKSPPKALLVISAHWEESVPTVMSGEHPPMLYDYYGFPPESYQITWPAPFP